MTGWIRWLIDYQNEKGKTVYEVCINEKDAIQRLKELHKELPKKTTIAVAKYKCIFRTPFMGEKQNEE